MIIPCEKLFLAFACSFGWIAEGNLIEVWLLKLDSKNVFRRKECIPL